MTGTARPLPDHGTLSRRKYHGCNCEPCLEYERAYKRNRHRQIGYGTWQPFVDAEPVRAHLRALGKQGLGWQRAAELSGLSMATVEKLLYGRQGRQPTRRVRPETADAILAVRFSFDALAPGAQIPALGTVRRLQALVAAGWPNRHLGEQLGINPRYVTDLLKNKLVTAHTARLVREGYGRLHNADPLEHGVTQLGVNRARSLATRKSWPGPGYWDDDAFDDPDFVPAVSDDLNFIQLGRHRRAEIEHLASFGLSETEIAARLDMRQEYVHDIVRDLRAGLLSTSSTYGEAA